MTGPMIMGSHIVSIAAWFSLALVTTSISHCGYHLPFLPSPEFHDFHHLKYVWVLSASPSPPTCGSGTADGQSSFLTVTGFAQLGHKAQSSPPGRNAVRS